MGFDWDKVEKDIIKHGTRNSLLTAVMPTAATSQIMGNCEGIDIRLSNIYIRTTHAGTFVVANPYLIQDLIEAGVWSEELRKKLVVHNGSIQKIKEIPQHIKDIYKTAFEVKQKSVVQQSADRGPFIDQSQSLNIFVPSPNLDLQAAILFDGWKKGLKTGQYYLRTRPAVNPLQFGIDVIETQKILAESE